MRTHARTNPSRAIAPVRRGFTLLETVLALTLSSLVLMSAFGVMLALSTAERQLAADHRNVNELANTQTVLRRTFMRLRMDPDATTMPELTQGVVDEEALEDQPDPQTFRVILTEDTSTEVMEAMRHAAPGPISVARRPQRLEVVVNPTPVPPRGGQTDPSQGSAVRGVFELRPDGWREWRIALARQRLGEGPGPTTPSPPQASGWTLWWTPLSGAGVTIAPLRYDEDTGVKSRVVEQDTPGTSYVPRPGTTADDATRTAVYTELDASPDSVALISGLAAFQIRLFRERTMNSELLANAEGDMPAYASVTLTTLTGRSAEWLFEIGWETGDDPMMAEDDASLDQQIEGGERTIDGDNNNAGGGGGGAGGRLRRFGGGGGRGAGGRGGGGRGG